MASSAPCARAISFSIRSVEAAPPAEEVPPWEESAPQADGDVLPPVLVQTPKAKVNSSKVKLVAELLGLSEEDEEVVLARLIDEFLALKRVQ